MQNDIQHTGIKGMKWGHRKSYPSTLTPKGNESTITKKVINDHNTMTDQQFKNKYAVSKQRYAKRVEKYGDPYMNSPLAKMGKSMAKNNAIRNKVTLDKQEKKGPINKNYSKTDRLFDQHTYGTHGVQRISKRMDKGQSYKKAARIQTGQDFVKRMAVTAITIDVLSGGALHKAGMRSVSKFMKSEAARKSIVKIAQNSKFDPIDVAYKIL